MSWNKVIAILLFLGGICNAGTHMQQGDSAGGCLGGTFPNPSCPGASGGSGGIVSPGTFTWVNNFGINLSTAVVSSTFTLNGEFITGGSAGNSGQVLVSNGLGLAPTFVDPIVSQSNPSLLNASCWINGSSNTVQVLGTVPVSLSTIQVVNSTVGVVQITSPWIVQTTGVTDVSGTRVDNTVFSLGFDTFTPVGGEFNDSVKTVTAGKAAVARITPNRGLHVNLRDQAGDETGIAAAPIRIDPTGTTIQPISGSISVSPISGSTWVVTGSTINIAGTIPISGSINSSVVNITTVTFNGLPQPVSGTFFQSIQPVSGSVTANISGSSNAVQITGIPTVNVQNVSASTISVNVEKVGGSTVSVNVDGGILVHTTNGVSGGTSSTYDLTFPSLGTPIGGKGVSGNFASFQMDSSSFVKVNVAAGGVGGGTAQLAIKNGAGSWIDSGWQTGGSSVPVHEIGTANVSATQSGTWTVQPGNTANTTAWKVDGSAVTQPVSGTLTANQGGTWNINSTVTNISTVTFNGISQPTTASQNSPSNLRASISIDGSSNTITANQGGSWSVSQGAGSATPWQVDLRQIAGATFAGSRLPVTLFTGSNGNFQTALVDTSSNILVAQSTNSNLRASVMIDGSSNTVNSNLLVGGTSVSSSNPLPVLSTGTITVNQGTLSSSPWQMDIRRVGGATVLTGPSLSISGNVSTGTIVSNNYPVLIGGIGYSTVPGTTTTNGSAVNSYYAPDGAQVVTLDCSRQNIIKSSITIAASTSETVILSSGSTNIYNDLIEILALNTSGTAVRIDFRSGGNGTAIDFALYVPAGDQRGKTMPHRWPQSLASANWTAQVSSSVTDIRIYGLFCKTK